MSNGAHKEIADRELVAQAGRRCRVAVCQAAGCLSTGAAAVREALDRSLADIGLEDDVEVYGTGCLGLCHAGPLVQVEAAGAGPVLYERLDTTSAATLVTDHVLGGRPVAALLAQGQEAFFSRQQRVVLENSGRIDPERIESCVAAGAYAALQEAVTEMTPAEVLDEVMRSGLRGRGGAGYRTGLKWSTVAKTSAARKYVICNGDEGDPGAFMDRSVLEGDPHRVLEGMAIGAYAVGAEQGYVYVRGEYPLAIARLKTAIRQAERLQFLGGRVFDTGFSFRVDIRIGAGAFVCGEETALIASIEGARGTPRPRPPYPAASGLWGQPTLINNVETLAAIPPIIRNGGDWDAALSSFERAAGRDALRADLAWRMGLIHHLRGHLQARLSGQCLEIRSGRHLRNDRVADLPDRPWPAQGL